MFDQREKLSGISYEDKNEHIQLSVSTLKKYLLDLNSKIYQVEFQEVV